MDKKTVLIVGASGLLGSKLFNAFSKDENCLTFGTYFSNKAKNQVYLDITNEKSVKKIIEKYDPDCVICPAANPNVEYCEESPEETRKTNVLGIKNIIDNIKSKPNVKFVYFSSEYVFDGESGPYSEEDEPHPINEYGKQKLEVENIIKENLNNYLIIRTTVVYGWERKGKNFVIRVIKNLKNNKIMRVPSDQISSPTYANNMADAVKELVDKDRVGIYNLVGSDIMDRYEFAKNIADIFNLNYNLIIPVSTKELKQKAPRPLNAGLKIEKAKKELDTKLVGVKEGLELMKNEKWQQ